MPHRNIRDVRTPDLVDVGQHPIAEQVGVDPCVWRRSGPLMLTVPDAKPIRRLGSLSPDQLTLVEQVVRGWLGL